MPSEAANSTLHVTIRSEEQGRRSSGFVPVVHGGDNMLCDINMATISILGALIKRRNFAVVKLKRAEH